MKVFKFGGASVKDAQGVRNLAKVLSHFPDGDLLIVVSAMGKTTNALERVNIAWQEGWPTAPLVEELRKTHKGVLAEVAPGDETAAAELALYFHRLNTLLEQPAPENRDQGYDQVVSFGEMWSTLIVSAHLRGAELPNTWADATAAVRTDAHFRCARVDWAACGERARAYLRPLFGTVPARVVTQGFIGATADGRTTTLGREGSDFSAAIFAYLLDAESVTIWKDVPGMFNADPNRFPDTRLLGHISYREAIELSYFGASVIHPRTLQPLQQKNIPLYVRSFLDLSAPGTTISGAASDDAPVPSFIVKPGQLLISITPRDLSFIVEENLSGIFKCFADHHVRIELMQNSAVAFSVAVDDTPRARQLIGELRREYQVLHNEHCELITVRHFDAATLKKLLEGKELLIEQRSRTTARFVVK